ncbi:MAG: hypothetical protein J1E95_09785 [Muribaculaceae bacterium]|nr:hypothetical protein [Muribaculaceae bacterium]
MKRKIFSVVMLASLLFGSFSIFADNCTECQNDTCKPLVLQAYDKVADGTKDVYGKTKDGVIMVTDSVACGSVQVYNKVANGSEKAYNKAKDGTVKAYQKTKKELKKIF